MVGGSAPNGQLSDILFISLNDRLNDISRSWQDASALPIRQFPLPTPYFASYRLSVLYHAAVRAGRGLHYMTPFISVLISYTFISLDVWRKNWKIRSVLKTMIYHWSHLQRY